MSDNCYRTLQDARMALRSSCYGDADSSFRKHFSIVETFICGCPDVKVYTIIFTPKPKA